MENYYAPTFSNTTGAAAIAKTVTAATAWDLYEIRIHLSAAGGEGNLTATMDAAAGAAYDVLLLTQDMTAQTDYVYHPEYPIHFAAGDELDIAWANAQTKTYGLTVIYRATV
jgi:hypothetical protein